MTADKLKEIVDNKYRNCYGYTGTKKDGYREALLAIKSVIHCQSILKDVTKVIHGEWIRVDGDVGYSVYQCSKCEEKVVLDNEGGVYDYCPHCGAKMDGERKDEE